MIVNIDGNDIEVNGDVKPGDLIIFNTIVLIKEIIADKAFGTTVGHDARGIKTSELFNIEQPVKEEDVEA